MQRYLTKAISSLALTENKIAFISGPRQVGKSTLARSMLSSNQNYYLYDNEDFMRAWRRSPSSAIADRGPGPIVLDEIHKDRAWKRRVKGVHDIDPGNPAIIVTGSARLDHYRKGSDSLLGRYLPFRLHPFSVAETSKPCGPDEILMSKTVRFAWSDLLELGGFPEPWLKGRQSFARQWSRLRLERLVLEDSRDIMNIGNLDALRTLIHLLPERVGSLLSVNALREEVGSAYATVRSWLMVLEALFYSFSIKPYSKKISRALRAEPKLFLFDILRIPERERSKRIENLSALHLKKACEYWSDAEYGQFDLAFVRDKEKREVDFLIVRDDVPWMLVECKSSQTEPAAALRYYRTLLRPKFAFQLVDIKGYDREYPALGIRVINYERFFAGLV